MYLLDIHRSYLSKKDIAKYRAQIVKEPSYSVCGGASLNTVIASGIAGMKADGFQLVKGQLNV